METDGPQVWRIAGCDMFSYEDYGLPGEFPDEESALTAARARAAEVEISQPSAQAGSIQDATYVVRPDGSRYRIRASPLAEG